MSGFELPRPLDWMTDALCAQVDPAIFHPEKGHSVRKATRVCDECEVRLECLDWALEKDERYGVLGGMGESKRRELRKKRGYPVQPPPSADHGRLPSKSESDLARAACPVCGDWMLKASIPRHMQRRHDDGVAA